MMHQEFNIELLPSESLIREASEDLYLKYLCTINQSFYQEPIESCTWVDFWSLYIMVVFVKPSLTTDFN